jgi:hypothetical protein
MSYTQEQVDVMNEERQKELEAIAEDDRLFGIARGLRPNPNDTDVRVLGARELLTNITDAGHPPAFIIIGVEALVAYANRDWFIAALDTENVDQSPCHIGSIFGSRVLLASHDDCRAFDLDPSCLYVVGHNRHPAVIQRTPSEEIPA